MHDKLEYYENIATKSINEIKNRWEEKWPEKTIEKLLGLVRKRVLDQASQKEIDEGIALQFWVEINVKAGIKFQEMMQNATNL